MLSTGATTQYSRIPRYLLEDFHLAAGCKIPGPELTDPVVAVVGGCGVETFEEILSPEAEVLRLKKVGSLYQRPSP